MSSFDADFNAHRGPRTLHRAAPHIAGAIVNDARLRRGRSVVL